MPIFSRRLWGAVLCLLAGAIAPSLAQTRPTTYPAINPALPTLWIIGDSTVRNGQDTGNNGQWGWGNPIAAFFDLTRINVQNRALGGTSSRTFQAGRWPGILAQIKPGDYLIMQFGHNDGGSLDDKSRARGSLPGNGPETRPIDNPLTNKHEIVHTYGWYLRQYVADANAKGAAGCMICSLIPRNHWADGKVDSHTKYPQWAADAARECGADFIDLHAIIAARYEALGQDQVTAAYFPDRETTHTDWAGAIVNAQCVVDAIKGLKTSGLAQYLSAHPPTAIALPSGKAR